jgi:hypothetical protein
VQSYVDAGFDEVYVDQIGPRQDEFFDFWRTKSFRHGDDWRRAPGRRRSNADSRCPNRRCEKASSGLMPSSQT